LPLFFKKEVLPLSLRVILEAPKLAIAFDAPTPGVIALFGPSGAGKTTTLLAIAGLLKVDRAVVELDGVALHNAPPEARGIGYVFQEGRLFPHMNVAANLRYGMRRVGKGPVKFNEIVDLLGIGAVLNRRPATLSGGERQRVAIGRALLAQPLLLLMDEPLSALDQPRRDEILPYLARLRSRLGIPIVYASHALNEVMRLADSLVLIENGRVREKGALGTVAANVHNQLAAREGAAGVLRGHVANHDPERKLTTIACGTDLILVPLMKADLNTKVRLLVPAREVILALDAPRAISVNNCIVATVIDGIAEEAASAAIVSLETSGGQLLARITLDASRRLGLNPGRQVLALIKAMSVELLEE
jgi:molybdate transport system ATP-binding protein